MDASNMSHAVRVYRVEPAENLSRETKCRRCRISSPSARRRYPLPSTNNISLSAFSLKLVVLTTCPISLNLSRKLCPASHLWKCYCARRRLMRYYRLMHAVIRMLQSDGIRIVLRILGILLLDSRSTHSNIDSRRSSRVSCIVWYLQGRELLRSVKEDIVTGVFMFSAV